VLALLAGVLATRESAAFEASGDLGPVSYRVLAPRWIWQGEAMSVLVVLTAGKTPPGNLPATAAGVPRVALELEFPEEAFEARRREEFANRVELAVAAGETRRFAFKGLEARRGVPRDLHPFRLRLRLLAGTGEEPPATAATLGFEVKTVRGAAVPEGLWSILVPAALSLLLIPAFALFLRRFSRPGSWRRVAEPEIPPSEDPWWTAS
jgi:hypothetical protein